MLLPGGILFLSGEAVQTFIKAFVRDAPGAWRCVAPATLDLPSGRIQVNPGSLFISGERFMNVDVAKLLEEEYKRQQSR